MKKKSIIACFGLMGLILFIFSCKPNNSPRAASSVNTVTTVKLSQNYLGLCDEFHEGNKPITVSIDVDKLDANGNIVSSFKSYRFFVQNDGSDPGNVEFSGITVPKSGTFLITVTADAQVCYQCCSGRSCMGDGGRPRFRGQYKNSGGVATQVFISNMIQVSCD